jgi:hypothetical protein
MGQTLRQRLLLFLRRLLYPTFTTHLPRTIPLNVLRSHILCPQTPLAHGTARKAVLVWPWRIPGTSPPFPAQCSSLLTHLRRAQHWAVTYKG